MSKGRFRISATAIVAVAAAVVLSGIMSSTGTAAEDHEYRYFLQHSLNPFKISQNDPQMIEGGQAYVQEGPTFYVVKYDGAGEAMMFTDVPSLKDGDWIRGKFTFRGIIHDLPRAKTTYIHYIKDSSGKGMRFMFQHTDDNVGDLFLEILGLVNGQIGVKLPRIECGKDYDMTSLQDVDYKIQIKSTAPTTYDNIIVTTSKGTSQTRLKTLYDTTALTRLSWGQMGAVYTMESDWWFEDVWVKMGKEDNELRDDPAGADPGIPSLCRWSFYNSLDPLTANDPHKSGTAPTELTSDFYAQEAWNYGMVSAVTSTDSSLLVNEIPQINLDPAGLDELDEGTATIKGKIRVKLDMNDSDPDDDAITILHRVYGGDNAGIRVGVQHNDSSEPADGVTDEARVVIQVMSDSTGTLLVDEQDEGPYLEYTNLSADGWADEWHYIYYKITQKWPVQGENWGTYTFKAWLDTENEGDTPECVVTGVWPVTTANLIKADWGVHAEHGGGEKWYMDDSWVAAGILDNP